MQDTMMQRTTISLPRNLVKRLKIMAAERGVSMAELIREAAEEKVSESRPKPKSIGIADSGRTDISQLASDWHIFEPPEWRSS
jgi:predicted DNA-binding ribbon-helix-helix protein